ncbi:MAG: hypothetical protein K2Y37_00885 [Pirellulales bacterium]|nr:hypothetical protein [Pirellulales bacterium]
MQVTYACPHCERTVSVGAVDGHSAVVCPACAAGIDPPADAMSGDRLERCLICPSRDLFVRKDFPQRLGVAIVVVGFVLSIVAYYFYWIATSFGILFATALIDVLLYLGVGNVLMCYRCGAQYRGLPRLDEYGAFELETHERYRQQAARLADRRPTAP